MFLYLQMAILVLGTLLLFKQVHIEEKTQFLKTEVKINPIYLSQTRLMMAILGGLVVLFASRLTVFHSQFRLLVLVAGLVLVLFLLLRLWRKRSGRLVTSRNFYKVYKYLFTQMEAGASSFQIYKSLYKVVDDGDMKRHLFRFSVLLTNPIQIHKAFHYLESTYSSEEGKIFIDILKNIDHNPLTHQSLVNVDQMLFQKYLSTLRAETKKIERNYILLIAFYTILTTLFLVVPLISNMMESASRVFN